jgi:hypothetical protein
MTVYVPRREFVELAYFAAEHGSRGTRVNALVTEGRDVGHYSSCGDLGQCCLFAAGYRGPGLNRKEAGDWRVGANISALWNLWAKDERGHFTTNLGSLMPGDIILLDGDTASAHLAVALTMSDDGTELLTADYGQPGGAIHTCPIRRTPGEPVKFRGRRWTQHLPLSSLTFAERALTVGEWAEERGAHDVMRLWFEAGKMADEILSDRDLARVNAE